MQRCAVAFDAQRARLDRINVYPVADGDTGTNLAVTFKAVVAELDGAASGGAASDMAATCAAVARGALMGARGNSGVIVSQVLRGACDVWAVAPAIDGAALADGLLQAARAARAAVAAPVEGTILTVLDASARAAAQQVADGADAEVVEVVAVAGEAAHLALDATPTQLEALAAAGVVDAGGAGWVVALDELATLVGADRSSGALVDAGSAGDGRGDAGIDGIDGPRRQGGGELGPRFEVSCVLEVDGPVAEELRSRWEELGESVVVGGAAGLWACHVHTDDVEGALAAASAAGAPRETEITDLHAQARRNQAGQDRIGGRG